MLCASISNLKYVQCSMHFDRGFDSSIYCLWLKFNQTKSFRSSSSDWNALHLLFYRTMISITLAYSILRQTVYLLSGLELMWKSMEFWWKEQTKAHVCLLYKLNRGAFGWTDCRQLNLFIFLIKTSWSTTIIMMNNQSCKIQLLISNKHFFLSMLATRESTRGNR